MDDSLIRTYGDNYIHVSEIDRFVEYTRPELSLEESKEMISNVEDPLVRAELERLTPRLSGNARYDHLPRSAAAALSNRYRRWPGSWLTRQSRARKIGR